MDRRGKMMWVGYCVIGLLTWASGGERNAPTPTARSEVEQKLKDMDREISRLRGTGDEAAAETLAKKVRNFRDRLEGNASGMETGAELHVVGIIEGAPGPQGRQGAGVAMVEVGATDRPVVLVLCAHDRVRWEVSAAPGAKLEKIVIGGYNEQRLEKAPAGVVTAQHTYEGGSRTYFYAYRRDSREYPGLVRTLKGLTGLDVATFQGEYQFAGKAFVVGPANEQWVAQRLLRELEPAHREAMVFERARQREAVGGMRFKAIHWVARDGQAPRAAGEFGEFTPAGPIASTLKRVPDGINCMAVDPRGPTFYGIDSHMTYRLNLETGAKAELAIKDFDLPRLSSACGLALDTKRSRLVLSSLGGEGFLYAYALEQNKWSLIGSLANVDLMALTYSAEEDCFYGLSRDRAENGGMVIHQYDSEGKALRRVNLLERVPMDSEGTRTGYQLACAGRQVVLLTPLMVDPFSAEMEEAMQWFLIDPKTGGVKSRGTVGVQPNPAGKALEQGEMAALWETLRGEDQPAAEAAMWNLAAGGDRSVAFIKSRYRPIEAADVQRVSPLVAKLDHDDFRVREAASDELVRMGVLADAELRKMRRDALSPEAQTRIEVVLHRIEEAAAKRDPSDVNDPDMRRDGRGAWVLGRIGTPAAVECLMEWAKEPGSFRAGQARRALRVAGQ